MKIQIVKIKFIKQKFHFRIVSNNGRILCSSEKYTNLTDCLNAIDSIKYEIKNADILNPY